jgi:hypothetical protein
VSDKDGERTPTLERDITFHERRAQLVVSPFYRALAYVASYHGWTSQRFEDLNREIIRLLPAYSSPVPAPGRSTAHRKRVRDDRTRRCGCRRRTRSFGDETQRRGTRPSSSSPDGPTRRRRIRRRLSCFGARRSIAVAHEPPKG